METIGQIRTKASVIGNLLTEMKTHVHYFFDSLDTQEIEDCINQLLACHGTIFITGVGKSGIIAKKIAQTLNSCGTKSCFLSPLDALHGDLGQVTREDCVLLLSKSGETDELLHLCPFLRNKGARLIGVVSNRESRLAHACDYTLFLPVSKELCPFDLAPTTSTLVQLMFGDLVAIALMQMKCFTANDFAKNHPSGRLGKRLTLKVSDLMMQGDALPLCASHDSLGTVLVELSNKKCGCVLVVDSKKQLLGIFTDGDLRRALQCHGVKVLEKSMQELMTCRPRAISPHLLAFDAMKQMEENQKRPITVLPVVEGESLVGLVRMHDIVQSGI